MTFVHRALHERRVVPRDRRLGLPWSEALARRTVRAVGGSLLAAEQALEHGLACHLAGGTHHPLRPPGRLLHFQ
jgi:acetoin utilization deacetylase AcuC-like enzyme